MPDKKAIQKLDLDFIKERGWRESFWRDPWYSHPDYDGKLFTIADAVEVELQIDKGRVNA